MKVSIGRYPKHYNTQQFADLLRHVGFSEDRCGIVGDWLHNTWVGTFCSWLSLRRGEQVIKVRIDPSDTWSMDHTLAHIILPMLKQLKETRHGAPNTRDTDVPKHLRSTAKGARTGGSDAWEVDNNHFLRWAYIMDEMLWAFEEHITGVEYNKCFTEYAEELHPLGPVDVDHAMLKKVEARKQSGFLLFGRYYTALWD